MLRICRDLKAFMYGGYETRLLGAPVEIVTEKVDGLDGKTRVRFLEGHREGETYIMHPDELTYED